MTFRNILLAFLIILAIGVGLAYARMQRAPAPAATGQVPAPIPIPEGATIITLTNSGFSPSEVTIKKGDTVTFRSEAGKPFWPASNLHPSHLLYPEFDPKHPIAPSDTWSFAFDKVGAWQFHDHLAPYFTGTITVTE